MVLIILLFSLLGKEPASSSMLLLYGGVSFLVSFILIRFLLETYIFRKIKLIYKIITESKDSLQGAKSLNSQETTLEDVNITVEEWADKKEKEISSLKSLEEYRRQYVGNISHELKTPLFSIQGYLHTLLEGGLEDEKINEKYLHRALVNVERLRSIVDDLEMINRLEEQSDQIEFSEFNLKNLVDEVINDLSIMASERNITLDYKQGADKAFNVIADRENIQRVLVNLINNSIKYGNKDGRTKVSFYDMDESVLIEISDNGRGISEENLKHVYDRFYRADKSRSREIDGTGLGLAIVKHIIEAHKQKLTLRSTLGKGSTFGFTLKRAR